jgi:lipid II:glycine glycyltransferase (peptidoglycan interpeptide bridge formation enzyme)
VTSKLEISILKDFSEWEDFLQKEEAGNIFQSPVMMQAYSNALKFDPYLLVVRSDRELLGGMLIYKRFPPKLPIRLVNELDTSYGPVVAKEITDNVKIKVIQMLLENTRMYADVGTIKHTFFIREDFIFKKENSAHSSNIGHNIFMKVGYRAVPHGYGQTFVIDLEQNMQSIFKKCEKRTRWAFNKAKKFNIKAQVENTQEGLKKFYKLYTSTAKRHNSIITPFNFLDELYSVLMHKGMMDIYIAYFDNMPISAAITLNYKNTAYYYMGASLKNFHYTQANTFLQFFIMNKLKDKGIKKYDLLCAPRSVDVENPQHGVYLFKKGFGGTSIPVFHYERAYNKLLSISEKKLLHIYKRLLRA